MLFPIRVGLGEQPLLDQGRFGWGGGAKYSSLLNSDNVTLSTLVNHDVVLNTEPVIQYCVVVVAAPGDRNGLAQRVVGWGVNCAGVNAGPGQP